MSQSRHDGDTRTRDGDARSGGPNRRRFLAAADPSNPCDGLLDPSQVLASAACRNRISPKSAI